MYIFLKPGSTMPMSGPRAWCQDVGFWARAMLSMGLAGTREKPGQRRPLQGVCSPNKEVTRRPRDRVRQAFARITERNPHGASGATVLLSHFTDEKTKTQRSEVNRLLALHGPPGRATSGRGAHGFRRIPGRLCTQRRGGPQQGLGEHFKNRRMRPQ